MTDERLRKIILLESWSFHTVKENEKTDPKKERMKKAHTIFDLMQKKQQKRKRSHRLAAKTEESNTCVISLQKF